MNTIPLPSPLPSPFHDLRWNAQQLADAVPLRLHALFAEGMPFPGAPFASAPFASPLFPAANDTRAPAPRRWSQGYACRRDLPARIRIHN